MHGGHISIIAEWRPGPSLAVCWSVVVQPEEIGSVRDYFEITGPDQRCHPERQSLGIPMAQQRVEKGTVVDQIVQLSCGDVLWTGACGTNGTD